MTSVLMLTWEYPPLIEGGLARHVHKLSENLVGQGVNVHVLTRGDERVPARDTIEGVHVHRVREPDRPSELREFITWVMHMNLDLLAAGIEISRLEDIDRIGVVHGHDWLVSFAGAHLGRLLDAPLVTTIHATEHGRHQGWVNDSPQCDIHAIEKWMANRSDLVIACSGYMREQICEVFSVEEEKVAVIPNGIDPGELSPMPERELERLRADLAAPDEKLVFLVGRLVYEKGFQLAVQAMPDLLRSVPNARFVIAGSGPHEEELRKEVRVRGLEDRCRFIGWIDDNILHSLYSVADLVIVPSLYEPFGLVALEAMASGCPCLVSDTGGLREVVPPGSRAGMRFRSGDPVSLLRAARRVLTDSAVARRVANGGLEHVRRFDWADVASSTIDRYEELHGAGAGAATGPWAPRFTL